MLHGRHRRLLMYDQLPARLLRVRTLRTFDSIVECARLAHFFNNHCLKSTRTKLLLPQCSEPFRLGQASDGSSNTIAGPQELVCHMTAKVAVDARDEDQGVFGDCWGHFERDACSGTSVWKSFCLGPKVCCGDAIRDFAEYICFQVGLQSVILFGFLIVVRTSAAEYCVRRCHSNWLICNVVRIYPSKPS
jgi:hypothetical protein